MEIKWMEICLLPTTPIIKVIEIIDASSLQIALVVDDNKKLLGTVTDGDIRRGIIKGIQLDAPVHYIMNRRPIVVKTNVSRQELITTMRIAQVRHIPIIDDIGTVVDLAVFEEVYRKETLDNWVVLMAGGLGSRLRPLTDNCPKPLLKVGDKPILETILESFIEHGFRKFYVTVNYRAEMIEHYFRDGSQWGAEIRYIREEKPLGTAGALSLLQDMNDQPFFVMNGDLLTKVNFRQLLDFHLEQKAVATMCVREYNFQVPFGVVKTDQQRLIQIDEKPVQSFFVNAGIYVIDPKVVKIIPQNTFFDMPDVFNQIMQQHQETAVFPIREYWLDIGHLSDFERANGEFDEVFK